MIRTLTAELSFFRAQPHNFRILSLTNMVYALVSPIIDIFVSAYIMRSSHDPTKVVVYQLTIYTGIPPTFLVNGFLLRHVNIRALFSAGMLLSGVSMLAMMSLKELSNIGIGAAGLIMGMSFGFYWANRDTIVLDATSDANRNYYYGLDTFSYTVISVVLPFAVGWVIHASGGGAAAHRAYLGIVAIASAMTIVASFICFRGHFCNSQPRRFIYLRFHQLWRRLLALALLKGLGQGFLVTAPAMLIMTLLGDEGSLGTAQMAGALVAAVAMYILGRTSAPEHRVGILTAGLLLFLAAAAANAILFDALGVVLFMMFLLIAKPMLDLAYYPLQFRVIDVVSAIEGRSKFTYIFSHETGLYVGRLAGAVTFLFLAEWWSTAAALRFAVLLVAMMQLLSVRVARAITSQIKVFSEQRGFTHCRASPRLTSSSELKSYGVSDQARPVREH